MFRRVLKRRNSVHSNKPVLVSPTLIFRNEYLHCTAALAVRHQCLLFQTQIKVAINQNRILNRYAFVVGFLTIRRYVRPVGLYSTIQYVQSNVQRTFLSVNVDGERVRYSITYGFPNLSATKLFWTQQPSKILSNRTFVSAFLCGPRAGCEEGGGGVNKSMADKNECRVWNKLFQWKSTEKKQNSIVRTQHNIRRFGITGI